MNVTHSHTHAWTGQQKATVAISGLLVLGFAIFMAAASGKPAWLALAALAPVAAYLSYRTNATRKAASRVEVTVTDGILTVQAARFNDGVGFVKFPISALTHVGYRLIDDRGALILGGVTADGEEVRCRVPARAFTPGNPVGPVIAAAADAAGVTVSGTAQDLLNR